MSMRPVDFQTIIPKLPEIHKSKSAENELVKNNLNINIQKEQQQYVQNTRQVVEANKAQEARINKDEKQKKRQRNQKDGHKEGQPEDKDRHDKKIKGILLEV